MKKKNLFLLTVLSLIVVVLASCHPKKDTIAKVLVYDNQNKLVSDCRVVLWGKASDEGQSQGNVVLYDTAYTDAAGEAIFNFNDLYQKGMAGVAILQIEAKKGNYFGSGMIRVKEEEVVEEKVFIHP